MDKTALLKSALANRKKKPVEGSPAEEASESTVVEAAEGKKPVPKKIAKKGAKPPFFQKAKVRGA